MNRPVLVARAYDNSDIFRSEIYKLRVSEYLNDKFEKDNGQHDLTTRIINPIIAKATIKAKQTGIIAGIEDVLPFYELHGIRAMPHVKDGKRVEAGEIILSLEGRTTDLLSTERTGLNFLQMMSGIATNTREYGDALQGYTARVAATRKDWADEWLEKKAIAIGGGLTHRLGLGNQVLIKDNHLTALKLERVQYPVEEAIRRAYELHPRSLEIEVKGRDEALRAAAEFRLHKGSSIPIIMLDNMSPSEEDILVPEIRDAALIEASGSVDLDTIKLHAQSGVDVISTSRLSRGAKALDLSQKILL